MLTKGEIQRIIKTSSLIIGRPKLHNTEEKKVEGGSEIDIDPSDQVTEHPLAPQRSLTGTSFVPVIYQEPQRPRSAPASYPPIISLAPLPPRNSGAVTRATLFFEVLELLSLGFQPWVCVKYLPLLESVLLANLYLQMRSVVQYISYEGKEVDARVTSCIQQIVKLLQRERVQERVTMTDDFFVGTPLFRKRPDKTTTVLEDAEQTILKALHGFRFKKGDSPEKYGIDPNIDSFKKNIVFTIVSALLANGADFLTDSYWPAVTIFGIEVLSTRFIVVFLLFIAKMFKDEFFNAAEEVDDMVRKLSGELIEVESHLLLELLNRPLVPANQASLAVLSTVNSGRASEGRNEHGDEWQQVKGVLKKLTQALPWMALLLSVFDDSQGLLLNVVLLEWEMRSQCTGISFKLYQRYISGMIGHLRDEANLNFKDYQSRFLTTKDDIETSNSFLRFLIRVSYLTAAMCFFLARYEDDGCVPSRYLAFNIVTTVGLVSASIAGKKISDEKSGIAVQKCSEVYRWATDGAEHCFFATLNCLSGQISRFRSMIHSFRV